MQRILFFITKGTWGGAQRYVYDLATHLPKGDFSVSVAFGQPGLLAEKLEGSGVKTRVIQSLERDVSFGNDLKSFSEILALLRSEKPDILHLNSSKAAGLGALAGRIAGVRRIIFTAHGWPFWEKRNPLARVVMFFFSWLTAFLSHKVIVVSEYDLKIVRAMPYIGHKTEKIYNGIALPLSIEQSGAIREHFPKGVKITGTIGELHANKNHVELIEKARHTPDMHLAIVGEGELRGLLEQKIKEYRLENRVKLFGFLPASTVLKDFDEFALPSLKEGLPYVLLEAKAAGLPIVANRVGGVGEILDAKNMSEFSLDRMLEKTLAVYG